MRRRILILFFALTMPLALMALAACGDENSDDDANGSGGAPVETPDRDDNGDSEFDYELVATEKTVPAGEISFEIDLAEDQNAYEELWERFRFEDDAPSVNWENEVAIFIGTGESGSCPLNLMDVRYDEEEHLITVDVSEDVGEDVACTDDWTPRAFVIAVDAGAIDEDELYVSLYYSGPGERELHPAQVRGADENDESTPTPEQSDTGDWSEVLISDKQFPEGVFDDPLFELAEDPDEFQEIWVRFGFEEDPPSVDWNLHVVLFAGTGESGTCPLFLNNVKFDDEHRVIVLDASTNLPEGTECTADWTPRVFVVAMDRDFLGEGPLRALFDRPDLDKIGPDNGEIIREE